MSAESPRGLDRAIASSRLGVGALACLAPRAALRVFAIDPDAAPALLVRAFGSRELGLGLGLLCAPDEPGRRLALRLGMLVDGADALAAVIGARRGGHSLATAAIAGGTAAAFVGLGLIAIRQGEIAAS